MGTIDNKIMKHKYNTRGKDKEEEYNKGESSDSDSDVWETEEEEDETEMDMKEYRKMLSKLFPSKYIKDKTKNTKSNKSSESEESKSSKTPKKQNKKSEKEDKPKKQEKSKKEKKRKVIKSKCTKGKTKQIVEESSESENSSDEEDIEELEEILEKGGGKFNIIFTMGGIKGLDEYSDEEDESYDDSDDSDYEEDESTDEDSGESSEEDEIDEKDIDLVIKQTDCSRNKAITTIKEQDGDIVDAIMELTGDCSENIKDKKEKIKEKVKKNTKVKENSSSVSDTEALDKFRDIIKNLSEKEKKNKVVQSMIKEFKTKEKEHKISLNKKTKKQRNKNADKFKNMLREKNVLNDLKFFRDKISVDDQKKILTEMEEVKKLCEIERPYRLTLLNADIPTSFKALAYRKIDTLKYMDPGSGEYFKIKNWVDTFMQIPFGKYKNLPLSLEDGVDVSHEFMDNAKKILDEAVFGLDDAKLQVMQMVGQWIVNPAAVGTAIAIKGPMGTGKTTLVKEGISKILKRDFAFIALGGATDSSFLEGHSYTYEGSTWGKIIDIIIQCKCMNPVIYFDELDKVSDTPKGEEIIGILTHLTDTTQNSKFHDKYFSELDFDLSRCLFIFSYNDESKVSPILRDRMYRIQTKGYDQKEKTTIAKDYLVKSIQSQVKFKSEDIIIPDDIVKYIVEEHTEKEDGVRNLKRCLEIIHTKLNLYRLMRPGTNLFEKDMSLEVKFPMTVTKEVVDKLIKQEKKTGSWQNMYL